MHQPYHCDRRSVCCLLLFVLFFSVSAYSQQPLPTQQQVNEMLPNGIDPTQLTRSGFDSYFKDNNQPKTAGNDRNKERPAVVKLPENRSLDRDSTSGDNIRGNAYSPDQTYGTNI